MFVLYAIRSTLSAIRDDTRKKTSVISVAKNLLNQRNPWLMNYLCAYKAPNKESLFAGLHILMRAILMAQRTPAVGFADTSIEEAAAKSTPAGKYKISVNPVILSNFSSFFCDFCAFLWLKNLFNLRNPCLTNGLRTCKKLYICRDSSTDIESSLQIRLFMQNKANFRKSQMNVNKVLTKDYEKRTLGQRGKNKANTNPIKAN